MKEVKGLKSTDWSFSHGGAKCSIGNTVKNTVITMYGINSNDKGKEKQCLVVPACLLDPHCSDQNQTKPNQPTKQERIEV